MALFEFDAMRIERAVNGLLDSLGIDADDPHLKDTARRVTKMYIELLQGEGRSPDFTFLTFPTPGTPNLIIQKGIVFRTLCAHHLLPFTGVAHIGYLPKDRIVGLSKLARVVRHFSSRLQLQERLTDQIHEFLNEMLLPQGVMVVMKARHLCQEMRGVRVGADTITSAASGIFLVRPHVKDEFLRMISNV